VILDGMGHDLTLSTGISLVDEISTHAQGAPTNESFAGYRVAMNRSLRSWSAIVAVVGLLPLTFTGTPSAAAASAHSSCRAPRLTGLTVTAARHRAKAAGCQLRLSGAVVKSPRFRQSTPECSPGSSRHARDRRSQPAVSELRGHRATSRRADHEAGTTELISGLFIEGGPFIYRSVPNCESLVGKSSGGLSRSPTRSGRSSPITCAQCGAVVVRQRDDRCVHDLRRVSSGSKLADYRERSIRGNGSAGFGARRSMIIS